MEHEREADYCWRTIIGKKRSRYSYTRSSRYVAAYIKDRLLALLVNLYGG